MEIVLERALTSDGRGWFGDTVHFSDPDELAVTMADMGDRFSQVTLKVWGRPIVAWTCERNADVSITVTVDGRPFLVMWEHARPEWLRWHPWRKTDEGYVVPAERRMVAA